VDSFGWRIFSYFFVLLCIFFYLSLLWVCGGGSKASGSYLRGLVLRGFEPPVRANHSDGDSSHFV